MTTLKDIFKKSFLEGYNSTDINVQSVLVALLLTAIIAAYIFIAYKVMTRKTFYSKNFNISLVGVALVTAAIIITIQSSVVVSLGMVGALSIVRFRTAVKDPLDLMFLFWAISTGIICGAGFAEYAIILALFLTVVLWILDHIPLAKVPMILVINASDIDLEDKIIEIMKSNVTYYKVKSRNMTSEDLNLTIEVRTNKASQLVRGLMNIENVISASLISHDGEVTF
ncbi:protein of unknown function [Acetitomaculum ruminis DSM 5522]|uniref:DUF4956 domain-containing protein n=1 Tax=Acetitomaculum ruminis DSM 5522 TaxID=1120918 RepID=A0A1I0Z4E4_9FIRM|nr:DUF4956 domain-containing protein [Acetitomaculum ruminis]SFB19318.1 protein of unknown function [Acetitomaculum ruminis DSM 5522]